MVVEVAWVGQLDFGFSSISLLLWVFDKTRRRRGGKVGVRRVLRQLQTDAGLRDGDTPEGNILVMSKPATARFVIECRSLG
jgi:hypothetical protein